MTTQRESPRVLVSGERREAWLSRYSSRLFITDFLVIIWAVIGSQFIWFGTARDAANAQYGLFGLALNYGLVSVGIAVGWIVALAGGATRDATVIGAGWTEYTRVINSTLKLFGLFAIVVYLLDVDVARGFIITAFPIGLLVLLASRWIWRQWLTIQRRAGRYSADAVLTGSRETVEHIARRLGQQPEAGYRVVGACIEDGVAGQVIGGNVRVLGDLDHVIHAMEDVGADTLIITSSEHLPPDKLRALSWSLEPARMQLIMAPALTDVGGPRIHTRPVAGLPLIHVETPRFEGGQRPTKRVFDTLTSFALLTALSIPMLGVALIIKLTSPGPVLFGQERIGRGGKPFRMLKFRSMVVDAEKLLDTVSQKQVVEGSVLFKVKDDPRITPFGHFIRRYSIDELPQLFNVLVGSMSLVGPRPPLLREVEKYETHVHRRFLVKPGLTGLWQVSGRSDLNWDESVRLDLYYVENWSLTTDAVILFRTVKAVFGSSGVY